MELVGNRYRLISSLGAGGMGSVYRAEDTKTGIEVALKMLHPQHVGKRAYEERFRTEADLAVRLNHPNVCRGLDRGDHHGVQYLALELLTGRSVAQLVSEDNCTFDTDSALSVVVQAAAGLDAMLQIGGVIAHRDLSSANIFVNSDGLVKVADFGIAKLEAGNETGTGSFLGNVNYMSPEQINDPKRVDARSDLYSLGIVLYEMLTGRRPFSGTPTEIANQHLYADPAIPVPTGQHSEMCRTLLARLLAKQPADRFPSPRAVIDYVTAQMPEVRPVIAKKPARVPAWAVAAAALALLVGVVMLSGILNPPDESGAQPAVKEDSGQKKNEKPTWAKDGFKATWIKPGKGKLSQPNDELPVEVAGLEDATAVTITSDGGGIAKDVVLEPDGAGGFTGTVKLKAGSAGKVYLVVSAVAPDGKTYTSSKLAISIDTPSEKKATNHSSGGAGGANTKSWQ